MYFTPSRFTGTVLLLAGALLLGGGVWSAAAVPEGEAYHKRTITPIGHEAWEPVVGPQPKVIYGTDDRVDVYQEQDPNLLEWSQSVCGLVNSTRLTQDSSGDYEMATSSYTQFGLPACPEEPFGNQPVAAMCSGFMVGEDLIVTAGHCYSETSLNNIRFVFGFQMENSTTPRLNFSEEQVYQGVEVVAREFSSENDYTVIRVDRPITASGAHPLPIRRTGSIAVDTPVGVIGHPAGLPMKIAFGEETVVRDSSSPTYFVANLDTYGGNSGSPIFNQDTGVVEGLLVRGDTDYIQLDNCFISNVLTDSGGRGEDASKTTVFEQHVPPVVKQRELTLSKAYYTCFDSLSVQLEGEDVVAGDGLEVTVLVQSGDVETLALQESEPGSGVYQANMPILEGGPTIEDGVIDVIDGDTITVAYQGEDEEEEQLLAEAEVDCEAPVIQDVQVVDAGTTYATIRFQTDEATTARVLYGEDCETEAFQGGDTLRSNHEITLSNLTPDRHYYFTVEATDRAGNVTEADNGGACFHFVTALSMDYFTTFFEQSAFDLDATQVTFTPNRRATGYTACVEPLDDFAIAPADGEEIALSDDAFQVRNLSGGAQVHLYDEAYDKLYIGSNGYLTFMSGETDYQPSLERHFMQPRVAPLFTDLNPEPKGSIFYEQLSDRVVVSYVDIPEFDQDGSYGSANSNSFQVEMFYSGVVRIAYLGVSAENSLTGLSRGMGLPSDFENSDFLAYPPCPLSLEESHSADINHDGVFSLSEVLRVIQFYAYGAHACDSQSEDGYAPGGGATDCAPHDSDYAPEDWQIDLSELLRLIQLYQAEGYVLDPDSEDGFAPIPPETEE